LLKQGVAQQEALGAAERDLLKRTRALDQVKAALEARELDVKRHEDSLADLKKAKAQLESEVGQFRERRIAELEAKEARLDSAAKNLEAQNQELLRHARALSEREQQQVERNRRLDERENALKPREQRLGDADAALRQGETLIKEMQDRLADLQRQKEDLLQTLAALRASI
jgi:chromosome segregation ATPase